MIARGQIVPRSSKINGGQYTITLALSVEIGVLPIPILCHASPKDLGEEYLDSQGVTEDIVETPRAK